jgi:hypothetical protein
MLALFYFLDARSTKIVYPTGRPFFSPAFGGRNIEAIRLGLQFYCSAFGKKKCPGNTGGAQ